MQLFEAVNSQMSCAFGLIRVQWSTKGQRDANQFLIKPVDLGPHFLCFLGGIVPFNTWLTSSWEEKKCCYKLSNWQNDNYFHSKWPSSGSPNSIQVHTLIIHTWEIQGRWERSKQVLERWLRQLIPELSQTSKTKVQFYSGAVRQKSKFQPQLPEIWLQ